MEALTLKSSNPLGLKHQIVTLDPKPRGSEYPNSTALGSNIHTLNGIWTFIESQYWGTCTLTEPFKPRTPKAQVRLDQIIKASTPQEVATLASTLVCFKASNLSLLKGILGTLKGTYTL